MTSATEALAELITSAAKALDFSGAVRITLDFRSSVRADGTIATVVSNTSRGAWPMVRAIEGWINERARGPFG